MIDSKYQYLQNKTNKRLIAFVEKDNAVLMQTGQLADESWSAKIPQQGQKQMASHGICMAGGRWRLYWGACVLYIHT